MTFHHSPTLPEPVYLSVNELLNTAKTTQKLLVNRAEKVHLYYLEPVKNLVNQSQPHKDTA
jgi:hypothetical protein